MKLHLALAWLLLAGCPHKRVSPRLGSVGPHLVSNQTATPVTIYGEHLTAGAKLIVGAPFNLSLPTLFADDRHLSAVIPAGLAVADDKSSARAPVKLEGAEGAEELTVVNDTGFPTPYDLVYAERTRDLFVVVPTTDELWCFHRDGRPVDRIRVGDGPRALAILPGVNGAADELVIAYEYTPELRLLRTDAPLAPGRAIPVRGGAQALAVDGAHRRIYVSNHRSDTVQVVDADGGKVVAELPAGVNPRALVLARDGALLVVANLLGEDLSLVDTASKAERRAQPRRGIPILGGRTQPYSSVVMGGKAARALAWSEELERIFVANIGPNTGPNPDRMEVSMNGGVAVVDPASGRFERHVSLVGGIPAGVAFDIRRQLLWVANLSRGQVAVFDARKLTSSDATARTALLAKLRLPISDAVPRIRPDADFDGKHAGLEIHSGPQALALADGGETLFVLSRFSGDLIELDVSHASQPKVRRTLPGPGMGQQKSRRFGEVVYYTDLGLSQMSCDGCHYDGHVAGVLYEKTHPLRIYRSSSLRNIRETPPYFFPGRLESLDDIGKTVLSRNRFHEPVSTPAETAALTEYQAAITALPNPYLGAGGELPARIGLPDGKSGDPRHGRAIFDGAGGCATHLCHAPPTFTVDQFADARGTNADVGTPMTQPIRPELQEARRQGLGVPSLVGVWDTFPLLASGAGGLEPAADGTLESKHPFALRWVLEHRGSAPHGNAAELSEADRNDLLAYLLTL
jgi:YVTN family beta-propeller protein